MKKWKSQKDFWEVHDQKEEPPNKAGAATLVGEICRETERQGLCFLDVLEATVSLAYACAGETATEFRTKQVLRWPSLSAA